MASFVSAFLEITVPWFPFLAFQTLAKFDFGLRTRRRGPDTVAGILWLQYNFLKLA